MSMAGISIKSREVVGVGRSSHHGPVSCDLPDVSIHAVLLNAAALAQIFR